VDRVLLVEIHCGRVTGLLFVVCQGFINGADHTTKHEGFALGLLDIESVLLFGIRVLVTQVGFRWDDKVKKVGSVKVEWRKFQEVLFAVHNVLFDSVFAKEPL